ncbi:hypothetical protein L596_029970 [Steinernema carpocapsae]|uniref:Peptidase M1 membrane alanine aminopeptidase domain-containing protein n=1 Tax=Steinernema carpocapsae TaxID=34508 RepID=A0A4U5LRD0_STECR|nr:hypothetical protein L596_029970 [Steinernema carpocapsae]
MPHQVPKIDFVGVSTYYSAVEHWGLVLFAEWAVFVNETDQKGLRHSWNVYDHEIAHFFFGNLVSIKWWNYYWIKEGMANHINHMFSDLYNPKLHLSDHWLADLNLKFKAKEVKYDAAVVQPQKVPYDIHSWFNDSYSMIYEKSTALIRMLHHYLLKKNPQKDLFVKALKVFLKRHQFGVVDDKDFWKVFSDVSGEDIEAMMTGWVTQKGFPIVEVKLTEDKEIRKLNLTQKRFLVDKESDPDHTLWDIPIEFYHWNANCTKACKEKPQNSRLKNSTMTIPVVKNVKNALSSFPIFNSNQYGYYIVKYDKNLFSKIVRVFPNLDVKDKIMILSDTSYLVQAGEYNTHQFLDLLSNCVKETDDLVLDVITKTVKTVQKWLIQ